MNGIILINKPKNWTSRDVVNKISKIYKTKKVGHTGTLDPLATGVLVICLGKYTKLVSELTSLEKEYIATMKIGILTDTLDITGKILKEENIAISKEKIIKAFNEFPKEYIEEVPKYSAVKVNGKKLYEYARENIPVEIPKKKVLIKELEILEINNNIVKFRTVVSKGTYIRSLIRDLGTNLNTVATMTSLTRTKQGNFNLEDCYDLDNITNETKLLSLTDIFSYQTIELNEKDYKKFKNGNILQLNCQEERIFVSFKNEILGIYRKENDSYHLIFSLI